MPKNNCETCMFYTEKKMGKCVRLMPTLKGYCVYPNARRKDLSSLADCNNYLPNNINNTWN